MASIEAEPAPEVMAFGPPSTRPRTRRMVVVVATLILLVGAVLGVRALLPKPPPDFSLVQLQGVYTGMVRSDGQNDLFTLDRSRSREDPLLITPAECTSLFDTTVSNQFAPLSLDGVSTYWLGEPNSTISLFTMRYPDQQTAAKEFTRIDQAFDVCNATEVTLTDRVAQRGLVRPTVLTYDSGVKAQLSYLFEPAGGGRYAIHLLQYANTISWQYRLDAGSAEYSPLAAQRLMDGLVIQMRAVQALAA